MSKGVPILDQDAQITYHADRSQAAAVYSASDVTQDKSSTPPGITNAGTRLQTTITGAGGIVSPISLELYMTKKEGFIQVILITYGKFVVAIPRLLSLYGPENTKILAADFDHQGFVVDRKTLFEFGGANVLHDFYWDRTKIPDLGEAEIYFLSSDTGGNKAQTFLKIGDQKTVSRKEQLLIFGIDNKPVLTLDADFIVPAQE